VSGKEVLEKLCRRGDWMAAKVRHDSVLGLLEDVEACGGAGVVAKALIKAEGVDGYLLYRLGDSFRNVGKLSEAIALYEEARGITARTVGKETNDDVATLNNLGEVYRSQGKLSEAIGLYEEALGIIARTVGKETESYASTLDNLALV